MGSIVNIHSSKTQAWQAYRVSFKEFSRRARALYILRSQPDADSEALVRALVELDNSRMQYNETRDVLASELSSPLERTTGNSAFASHAFVGAID
jgi:hypothetical protein